MHKDHRDSELFFFNRFITSIKFAVQDVYLHVKYEADPVLINFTILFIIC